MYRLGTELILSATDLANFLGCRHRTALDMAVAYGARKRPYFNDPLLDLAGGVAGGLSSGSHGGGKGDGPDPPAATTTWSWPAGSSRATFSAPPHRW